MEADDGLPIPEHDDGEIVTKDNLTQDLVAAKTRPVCSLPRLPKVPQYIIGFSNMSDDFDDYPDVLIRTIEGDKMYFRFKDPIELPPIQHPDANASVRALRDNFLHSIELGKHVVFKIIMDGELHLAPLRKDAVRILDVGTGLGVWAIESK